MFHNFRPAVFLCSCLCAAIALGMAGGCGPKYYKDDADKEVYKIIDKKWRDDFGQKVNYTISDVPPSPNDVQVEKAVPASGAITLAQAVAMATAHNRDYQTQKEDLYLKALDLTLERHSFATQWFGTFDGTYTRFTDSGTLERDETLKYESELGFNQMLADGAQISASIAYDWLRYLTGDPRASIGSVLSATITQPLLRNAGRKIAQETLTQKERDVLYQIRSFNRYRQEFVVAIVTDYYRVLQRRDTVTNAENNYKRRVESRQRLEMEADAGRTNRFEVDQARQRELDAMDSQVRAQQSYQQALDNFKIRLALPTDAKVELDQNELNALENIGISRPDYTVDVAIDTALIRRLDLATSMDKIDDAVRKVMVAENGLAAELDLVGGLEVGSTPPTDYGRLQFHHGTYSFGLGVDLPLDRKAERNAYRKALIELERQQRQYDNDEDTVKLEVRQAYRDLEQAAESYLIQKNSLDLAQKRVESTSLLLEAGRLTTRDLLESQDALLQAQNSVTDALVNHAIAKLSFFRDIGVLQVRPDGMWGQLETGNQEIGESGNPEVTNSPTADKSPKLPSS
ncbi:MAG: TolC family protein [Sedimentisphaerales bacterium]|nr:TolC family protein [Sedimentisphaerales bacterium]